MLEFDTSEVRDFFLFAQKITRILLQTFKAEAFDWSYQEKEAAGQTVPHIHLHIIPRKPNDLENAGQWYAKLQQNSHSFLDGAERPLLEDESLQAIIKKLKNSARV